MKNLEEKYIVQDKLYHPDNYVTILEVLIGARKFSYRKEYFSYKSYKRIFP